MVRPAAGRALDRLERSQLPGRSGDYPLSAQLHCQRLLLERESVSALLLEQLHNSEQPQHVVSESRAPLAGPRSSLVVERLGDGFGP